MHQATKIAARQAPRSSRQTGLSLVELMIAMAISLGMIAALVTLLLNDSRAHNELSRTGRQTENGRYAIELLSGDLKLAGFYGELAPNGVTFVDVDPCIVTAASLGFATAPDVTAPVAIKGFVGNAADPPPGCVSNHRVNTAVLVVRHVDTELAATLTANDAYLQTSRCASDAPATPFVFSSVATAFTLRDMSCTAAAPLRRYITRVYYVADCDVCGQDTIPTLKRAEFVAGAMVVTPLAQGIEDLQFEYGFDDGSDGTPDDFRTSLDGVAASPSNDWSNVMAVRVWMISRTIDASPGYTDAKEYHLGSLGDRGPFNDNFKRRVFSQSVRLNNPAGWRE